MDFLYTILSLVLCSCLMQTNGAVDNRFSTYYSYLWGSDHFTVNPQGTEVQLKLDQSSGAGFRSKFDYGSGLFHIRMKIPEKKTGGVVTTFYLTSAPDNQPAGNHFELDYEFLGTNGVVQTNVFDNDGGHREQSFKLWFNPSQDFHDYQILWNSHQIVFFIDNIPLRVFKNNMAKGIAYPNTPMHIEASIWNATWAGVVDWSQAPFVAHYSMFGLDACQAPGNNINDLSSCDSNKYYWNAPSYWDLNANQKKLMKQYRAQYMSYDYCANKSTAKPECFIN